jgi:inorganic pyrophosphatase
VEQIQFLLGHVSVQKYLDWKQRFREADPDERAFTSKKVLPAGMSFPYDFGFVPSSEAEDGDQRTCWCSWTTFCECIVKCRLIGVIEGEQGDGEKTERNDRLIGVEDQNHSWANIKHVDDLGKKFVKELEEFFVNYHQLTGKQYKVLDVKGPGAARKCVKAGMKAGQK